MADLRELRGATLRAVNEEAHLQLGPALDALLEVGADDHAVDVDSRRVHEIGVELADLDQLLDLGDGDAPGGGHHRPKVARGLAKHEVAPAVALPRLDEREVGPQAALEHVHAAVELLDFLALGDLGAIAGGRVEAGDASAARPDALGQRALRIELDQIGRASCRERV